MKKFGFVVFAIVLGIFFVFLANINVRHSDPSLLSPDGYAFVVRKGKV